MADQWAADDYEPEGWPEPDPEDETVDIVALANRLVAELRSTSPVQRP